MEPLGIGERSERAVMFAGAVVHVHDDYDVVLQPDRPDYWLGNRLALARPPTAAELPGRLAVWRREIGQVAGVGRITVSGEGDEPGDLAAAAAAAGLEVDRDDVLALGTPQPAEPPPGVTFAPVAVTEWPALVELYAGDARDAHSSEEFARWQMGEYRRLVDRGRGEWWAAWDGQTPVAGAGLFRSDSLARYQHVVTHPRHQRRGIAAALVGLMATDHRARFSDLPLLIVAERDSSPARIYRRLGFERVSGLVTLSGAVAEG